MKNSNNIGNTYAGYVEDDSFIDFGTVIVDKYEIIELLGCGGMGQVYLAKDLHLNRLVAVKTLSQSNFLNSERKARFFREAQMASALNHPNILSIYDIVIENEKPFLIMEYVDGQTLREVLNDNKMNLALALDIAIQLAQGLLAMHNAGIIHRDLKLDNFILRKDGYLKILDFGLAKPVSEKENLSKFETKIGLVIGTPRYMSPEQARGKELDCRSDIFSFGSVFYELLSHRLAFDEEDDMQSLYQVVFSNPTELSEEVPTRLRQLLAKIMQKNPDNRTQSIQEVLDELLITRNELDSKIENQKVNYFNNNYIAPNIKKDNLVSLPLNSKNFSQQVFIQKSKIKERKPINKLKTISKIKRLNETVVVNSLDNLDKKETKKHAKKDITKIDIENISDEDVIAEFNYIKNKKFLENNSVYLYKQSSYIQFSKSKFLH
ncbi:MAG: serine/threonine protein kinase [Blastocatellia bacterium]|nr:serine/threonine protein kinase [Blastocatellia bacterium]MBN8724859.1 serine/threonine protein kinase [Acidobacteriota bacterium]